MSRARSRSRRVALAVALAVAVASPADAAWTDNLRIALDVSERVIWSEQDAWASQFAVGLDVHKVFADDRGDWGTATLQGYLTRIDDQPRRPPFFEGPDDWEFVFRIFNFNLTRFGRGRLNLRAGHFEIPYGLEHSINTNGTIRDFTHGANLGVKADWGVSVNGVFPRFEYEIGVTRGIVDEDHSGTTYLVAGRIGTPPERGTVFGLSFFHGWLSNRGAFALWRAGESEPTTGDGHRLKRTRFAIDGWTSWGPFVLLGEVSYGWDFDQDVVLGLAELDWTDATEAWSVYAQLLGTTRERTSGWRDSGSLGLGFRYAPDARWAFSGEVRRELWTFGSASLDTRLLAQLRFRR